MSKISNKVIEAKLKEILANQGSVDLSKFEDNTALSIIFAYFEDRLSFGELLFDQNLNEIQELKLIELELRTELEFYKAKEREAISRQQSDGHLVESRIIEESRLNSEKCKQLQKICEAQEELLKKGEQSEHRLQKKILEGIGNLDVSDKQRENLKVQLDSFMKKDEENKLKIQNLLKERENLTNEHEQQIKKYKGQFIEKLTEQMNKKHDEQLQQIENLNQKLQKQLKDQENLLKQAIHCVSELFRMPEPADLKLELNGWVQRLSEKFQEYRSEVKKTVDEDIKEPKNPIRKLAENQKKQIQARQLLLSKYLNA